MTTQLTSLAGHPMPNLAWAQEKVKVRLDPLPFPFVLLLIVGFALGVEVQFNGLLFVGEILLAMFAFFGVFLNLGNVRFWTRDFYRFLICLAVSYLAYLVTDLFVGTPINNLLRGWARIGFLTSDIVGIYVICRRNRYNLFPLMLGLAFSALLMPHEDTSQGGFAAKWKFDLYFSWVSSVCILATYLGRRRAAVSALLCLIPTGIISFLLDSRLVGGASIAVAVVLVSKMLTTRRQRKLLLIVLGITVFAGAVGTFYLLNETGQEFAVRRASSNVARATAILTALQQIGQHPFLGTGSWNVSEMHLNRHRANTSTLGGKQVSEGMALGHSQILQAAVEGGILGSTFFVCFLVCLGISLVWSVKRPLDRFSAFAMFNLLMCIWHCLLSPQGGSQRIEIATGVCICLLMMAEKKAFARRCAQQS